MKKYIYMVMTDKRQGVIAFLFRVILTIASFFYGVALRLLRTLKTRSAKGLPCKVISVGNLTMGGTGKTPFACMVAKELKGMGRVPGVLIRGYGDDEWKMLKRILRDIPVLVGPDRVSSGMKAHRDFNVDTAVLDDGFQHWRLKRDLDIVLIDATDPLGNAKLFPRGILREGLGSLARADIVVLTKTDMGKNSLNDIKDKLRGLLPEVPILESRHVPTGLYELWDEEPLDLKWIEGKDIAALSSIANTKYFEYTLKNMGGSIRKSFDYADHYNYKANDLKYIFANCEASSIDTIVTTEKDAVKLNALRSTLYAKHNIKVVVVRVELKITNGEKTLNDRIHNLYSG